MRKTLKEAFELQNLINKYNEQYYKDGESEISDAQYDRLYEEYEELELIYPELKSNNSPTMVVGAGDKAKNTLFEKIKHKSPLLSINRKSKDLKDLKDFYESLGGNGVEVLIQPKLDGITCNINYENYMFLNAATRGNGYIGDDITNNFIETNTVYPKQINGKYLELRGEAVIPYDYFKENLKNSYSNPRNAVAGIMRSIDSNDVKGKGVQVLFYDVGENEEENFLRDEENLVRISNDGFASIPTLKASSWKILKYYAETKMDGLIKDIDGFNVLNSEDYPKVVCDGLVIKVNDLNKRKELGMTEKGPRWAFAYKFKPLNTSSILRNIEWQVGKTGVLTPVAVFDEVSLGGVKINKATLNNINYINELKLLGFYRNDNYIFYNKYLTVDEIIENVETDDILYDKNQDICIKVKEITVDSNDGHKGILYELNNEILWTKLESNRFYFYSNIRGLNIGDEIIIERSNDVIPRIIGIKNKASNSFYRMIDKCPICRQSLTTLGPQTFCVNSECKAQIIKKIAHFTSRDAMNIVGLGESIITDFYNKGFIQSYNDIYNLEKYKDEIIKLEGYSIKKYQNIISSIEKSKNPKLENFIYSLAIPNVGIKNAKEIASLIESAEQFLNEKESFEKNESVVSLSIVHFLKSNNINKLKELISIVKPKNSNKKSNELNGKTFVITGTLKKPRKYYENIIESKGGKVSSTVSKNTYAIICGENAGSKLDKAKKLIKEGNNILLIQNEDELYESLLREK